MGDMNNVCLFSSATIFEELNLFICTHEKISDQLQWMLSKY